MQAPKVCYGWAVRRKLAIDWDAQPLGVEHDKVIASRLGVTPQAVYYARRQRGIHPSADTRPIRPACDVSGFVSELGQDHDRVVAESHGLTAQQVARARRKHGIPGARLNWDLIAPELGTAPDIVVARRYGVDNKVVALARWRRGIPRWQEQRKCPCGELYIAFHLRQNFCSYRCQRYHWHVNVKEGQGPEAADLAVAMAAYRRTMKRKAKGTIYVEKQ